MSQLTNEILDVLARELSKNKKIFNSYEQARATVAMDYSFGRLKTNWLLAFEKAFSDQMINTLNYDKVSHTYLLTWRTGVEVVNPDHDPKLDKKYDENAWREKDDEVN